MAPLHAPLSHPWDDLLMGEENELALAGAQVLARSEREGISPLVIHGPVGAGKSRLLAGLVVEWLHCQPGASIAHLNTMAFAEAWLEAARYNEEGNWSKLRTRYRTVRLLVLDDLENLERAPLARGKLIHTLDALDGLRASIAVSRRTSPSQWSHTVWPARLVNRLIGELVARISPRALVSRQRYVLEQARATDLALSAEAAELLATTADGYRTLAGWLAHLALQTKLALLTMLDLRAVTAILRGETELLTSKLTVGQIARVVAIRFGVRVSALRGPSRQASVVEARHLAMYLARLYPGLSYMAIGIHFGGRDPATVRHGCKATAERLSANPTLAALVDSYIQDC